MTTIYVPYHLDERLDGLVDEPADVTVAVEFPEDTDIWGRLVVLYDRLADEVRRAESPVVISGDCTTALGTVAGLQRGGVDPAVVWFDAHGDVQTLETTTSGYIGGMPLRVLVGYRPELIADRLGLRALDEERAVLVDARDLDPAEEDYLRTSGIRRYQLQNLELPDGPLVVHVDLDVVDAGDLPGLLFPVPGGPSMGDVLAKVQEIIATGRVVAVDLACTWRPGNGAEARGFIQTVCKGFRKDPNKFRTQRDH
ncbi:arginase family protein [Dactylosporangium sp. NPDC050688]|uniref:arginase family protein n=1 Tax=Dactylosporangium sp. NPDC050688 TaxID=3157217 RepID=UPI0033E1D93E